MNIAGIVRNMINHPLNKHSKLNALKRLFKWQLGSFVLKYPVVFPFVENSVLVIEKGMTGATGNIYNGLHEHLEMLFVLHVLRKGDLFADVGANIGSYTILAAVNCHANVVAFEPVPATFFSLKRNVLINDVASSVRLINKAVGSEVKTLTFTIGLDAANHVLAATEDGSTCIVECTRLDDEFSTAPLLMKIDVEGFETEVIKGGSRILASENLKAIIIELNGSGGRYGYQEEDIHNHLISLGFKPYQYDPFTRQMNALTEWGTHNTIYARDLPFILSRTQSAKPFSVNGRVI